MLLKIVLLSYIFKSFQFFFFFFFFCCFCLYGGSKSVKQKHYTNAVLRMLKGSLGSTYNVISTFKKELKKCEPMIQHDAGVIT